MTFLDTLKEAPRSPHPSTTRVLLIEDEPADAYILRRILESEEVDECLELVHSACLDEGLAQLEAVSFDCVLLDLQLPDSQGLGTFEKIRQRRPEVPVVVLSGLDDKTVAVAAVREGAQDYLVKGRFDGQLLSRAIRYAIERHQTQELLRSLSIEDDLTGLYNRRGFLALAEQQLKIARRKKQPLLLIFGDLDGLKEINDTFGHDTGNRAIVEAAEVLRATFRESDILARLGGDELVALLHADGEMKDQDLIARLEERVAEKNAAPDHPFELGISLGMAEFAPGEDVTLEQLMKRADEAMYTEKRRKKRSLEAPS